MLASHKVVLSEIRKMLDPLGPCVQGVTVKLCLPKCMWEFKQAPGYLVYSRLLQTMFGLSVRVLGGLVFVCRHKKPVFHSGS